MKKKILVACGTGIATSTVVVKKIEKALEDRGCDCIVDQCKAAEVPGKAKGFDLIVATTTVSAPEGIPVIQTVSFLTGIGEKEDIDKITAYLKS